MGLLQFTDKDFEEKIKNEELSIIQFSTSWCAPCRSLSPVLEKLSQDYQHKFWYGDVEEGAINTASAMGIKGVPSTIIFSKGLEIGRLVGFPGEVKVKEFLDKFIK